MDFRRLLFGNISKPQPTDSAGSDISQLLFVTARPVIQALLSILVLATLVYTFVSQSPRNYSIISLLVVSYVVVVLGNHYFPFEQYHPMIFFALMCSFITLIVSLVYLTGNRVSLLGFLFFAIPIYAAAYYSYPGTILMSALTALARFIPFMNGGIDTLQALSLGLTAASYFVVGFLACYVVEGEKLYARESSEYKKLLEISRAREREISTIYNLSRKFSYTLDLDTILKTTAALARNLLSSEGTLVWLEEGGEVRLKAAMGVLPFSDISAVRLPLDHGWVEQLAAGNTVISERVKLSWLPLPPKDRNQLYGVAAVPLLVGREIIGYLICFSPAPRDFNQSHLEIMSTLASQAAVAVEKARLYERTLADKTKLQIILSALRDGLLVTDFRGELVQANRVAEKMLGIDESSLGARLSDLLHASTEEVRLGEYTLDRALSAALKDGQTIFGEMVITDPSRVTVQAHYIPLKDMMGNVTGMVLFLHDITELRRIDDMKSNFISNVSHELRTPLTSILGYVSLLLAGRAGALTPQQEQYLDVVSRQTSNLASMIESLLDLSRLRESGAALPRELLDVAELATTAVKQLSRIAAEKQIDVNFDISEELPPVRANSARITQVFTNILDNALKYTPAGGRVDVSAVANGPFVQVRVKDNGIGISQSALPHVFDRFFQAHSLDEVDEGGFGLGLAISREVVEFHGGSIWVESEPGKGSTFYFTLPAYGKSG